MLFITRLFELLLQRFDHRVQVAEPVQTEQVAQNTGPDQCPEHVRRADIDQNVGQHGDDDVEHAPTWTGRCWSSEGEDLDLFDDPEEERLQGREQTQEPDEWKTWQDDEADLLDQPDRLVAGLVLKGGLEEVRDVGADGQEKHMNGPGRKATMEPFSAIRIFIRQTLAF